METEPPRAPLLHWSGHTDRGKVRINNEDSFLLLQFDADEVRYLGKVGDGRVDGQDFVFAVGDGMGGAMAGEFASRVAVEQITKLLPRSFRLGAQGLAIGFEELLTELFHNIHEALTYLGGCYEECRGMGTTLSLCWIRPGWMHLAHIGDSRIYFLPAGSGELKQLTADDTHVGWLRRQGKITEREARNHPRRTSLSKALGAGHQFVNPQVGAISYEKGDRFLICSDGVVDGLFDHQILRLLCGPDPHEILKLPAQRLVDSSVDISGKDNTTAVVVEVD